MAKNDGGVNYIRHLLSISEKFIDDDRLSPLHISLYYAVFQSWNLARFANPISVNRAELMQASKIGSANTYTKCLTQLDTWGYIKYSPSFNPHKGSQIYLYTFNKTTNNGIDIPADKSTDKASKKTSDKANVKVLIPSINSINNKNKLNLKNENEHTRKKNNRKIISSGSNAANSAKQKSQRNIPRAASGKKNSTASPKERGSEGEAPSFNAVQTHFIIQKWPLLEAQKFFNHYESNGWLVAGKTPMKNWKASANKWMLNTSQFFPSSSRIKGEATMQSNKLHVTTNKNYNEPL